MSLLSALRQVVAGFLLAAAASAASHPPIPPLSTDVPLARQPGKQTAVFAGGCFWGVQAVFQRVKGVLSTAAGYAGGSAKTATYNQVTTEWGFSS
jgi:peptide-methionine (S)-S-oxide reductase